MRIPNIYVEQTLANNSQFTIDGQAAQHIAKVLRMQSGEKLRLFDGSGFFFLSEIIHTNKKHVEVTVLSEEQGQAESPVHTHLGQVMSRGDRMDYAIQKSTEMGVSEITPLSSERCEVRLNAERSDKRVKHWQQVAISAAEQCGRATVPKINPVIPAEEWVAQRDGLSLVLHHRDTQQLDTLAKPEKVNLLIGPEGGLSEQEINRAIEHGFISTTFGPRVMRTETAPVTSLAIVQWLWGDFQKD